MLCGQAPGLLVVSGKELSRNRVSANTLLAPQAKKFFYGQATTSPLLNAAPSTPRASERERGAANQVVVLLRGSIYYLKSGVYNVRLSIYTIGYMPAANRCGCRWPASWQVTAGTGGERAAAFATVSCAALVLPF